MAVVPEREAARAASRARRKSEEPAGDHGPFVEGFLGNASFGLFVFHRTLTSERRLIMTQTRGCIRRL